MDDLESFRARYPFDDDAYNYIVNSSLEVQQEVLRDFKPKQEGEEDYSALVMGFTKRRRQLDKERRMHGGYAPPNQMMPDHGNGSIHDELQAFLDRYPVDEEAQRFLNTCPPHVQRIIFQTFKPKREGEADYSALLISFAKRVRQSQPKAAPFMDFAAPYEHIVPPRDLRPAGGGSGYGRVQGVNYEAFRARYPFDDAAHNYLQKLPPDVRIHVLQNFKPPQEGESDYSALVISYCKKTREAMHPPPTAAQKTGRRTPRVRGQQVMDLQPRDGSEHRVFVRNTFLEVQDEDEVNEKNALKRSNSWSASSSSSMSSAEDFVHTLQQQAGPGHMTNHFVWNNDSEVSSESAISGSTVPRSSLEDQLRQERMAQVQAKIRELTQNDPLLSGEGDDMPPADIVYSWSAGSANHAAKKCTPCIHFTTKAGCKHGDACRFCHLEHTEDSKRGRHRPCKATRNQCKHLLSQMNDLYKDDPEQKRIAYQTLAEQSPYMKSLLKGVLDPEEASALDAPRRPGLQQDGRAKPSEGSGKSKKKNLISL